MCREGPGSLGCGVCEEAGSVELGATTLVLGEIFFFFFFCGSANQKGELGNLAFSFVKLGTRFGVFKEQCS